MWSIMWFQLFSATFLSYFWSRFVNENIFVYLKIIHFISAGNKWDSKWFLRLQFTQINHMISHIRHFERYHNFRRQDQFRHMQYAPNWCKYLYVLKILSNDNPINASFIWYIWKYLIKPRYEHVFLAFATTCFKHTTSVWRWWYEVSLERQIYICPMTFLRLFTIAKWIN